MIPAFNASGVLPPFIGENPTAYGGVSPYVCTMSEVHARFVHTPERRAVFDGLLRYRRALTAAGIVQGYQFVDGSFVEDCEQLRGRAPDDVDVITFAYLPASSSDEKLALIAANPSIFDPEVAKDTYHCHAFFQDLGIPGHALVKPTCYWFGLFSHQRVTALWKGMLVVPLQHDDEAVALTLSSGGADVT